ncbi:MAG: hypothetical protein IPO21_03945 [Bacteroidales bacterium]|nr:hypothetical protein [Bacteroidales bacterium]
MKRILIICIMMFLALHNLKAARIITGFDVARWYLESDLVLICHTNKIDTLFLSHYDESTPDSLHLTFDLIREIYHITIDSILKPDDNLQGVINSISSQEVSINYSKSKQGEDEYVYTLNKHGDTVGIDTLKTIIMRDDFFYDGDDYLFPIDSNKKYIVMLFLSQDGYMISYKAEVSDSMLELIAEVKAKGETYFEDFFKKE